MKHVLAFLTPYSRSYRSLRASSEARPRRVMTRQSARLCAGLLLLGVVWGSAGCRKGSPELGSKQAPNPLIAKEVKGGVSAAQILQSAAKMRQGADVDPAVINKALGGFVYKAKASYASTRKKRKVSFNEDITIQQHEAGPFRIRLTNNRKKATEVVWDGAALFWRGKGRPFRKVSDNVDSARRWQLRSYGRWRALVQVFGDFLRLEELSEKVVAGRPCRSYRVALRSVSAPSLGKVPQGTAWRGALPEHTRGQAANKPRTPAQASGTLCVDQALGFPLSVDFRGAYRVGNNEATVKVTLRARFVSTGPAPIKTPKKVATVSREPEPLDAFGKKKPLFFQPPPSRR